MPRSKVLEPPDRFSTSSSVVRARRRALLGANPGAVAQQRTRLLSLVRSELPRQQDETPPLGRDAEAIAHAVERALGSRRCARNHAKRRVIPAVDTIPNVPSCESRPACGVRCCFGAIVSKVRASTDARIWRRAGPAAVRTPRPHSCSRGSAATCSDVPCECERVRTRYVRSGPAGRADGRAETARCCRRPVVDLRTRSAASRSSWRPRCR